MFRRKGAKLITKETGDLSQLEEFLSVDLLFEKATAEENGDVIIEGYASTSDQDADGDVVAPRAFEKSMEAFMRRPIIRREHKHPIGLIEAYEFREKGIWVRGRVTHDAPGEQTRDMIKRKLLRGMSAGFLPARDGEKVVGVKKNPKGRFHFEQAHLKEITVTDLPRNDEANIVHVTDRARTMLQKSLGATSPVTVPQEDKMDWKLLAQMLTKAGFSCDAGDEGSIITALNRAIAAGQGTSLIAKALGKTAESPLEDLLSAVTQASDRSGLVEKAKYDELLAKLKAAESTSLLAEYANRIPPAQKEFAKSLVDTDPALFKKWAEQNPMVPVNSIITPGLTPPATGGSNEDPEVANLTETLRKSFGVIDKPETLAEYASLRPHEIVSRMFGQPVSETPYDRMFRESGPAITIER